jgi:hypothetical protein
VVLQRAFTSKPRPYGNDRQASRGDIRAHQHEIGAQFLQQIEFALGAIEYAATLGCRHSFEVAKRLEGHA